MTDFIGQHRGSLIAAAFACALTAIGDFAQGVEIAAAPIVAAYERFGERAAVAGRLDTHDAGRILIGELGCTACHTSGDVALTPKAGPDLAGVGTRVKAGWLRHFLLAPAAAAPGTTMPHVLAALPAAERVAAIDAIAAYLATRTALVPLPKPNGLNPMPPAFWDRGDPASGAVLYHRVGCVACHPPEEGRAVADADPAAMLDQEELAEAGISLPERAFPSLPLAHVGAKYSQRALTEFLMVPLHARPSGRMPAIPLKAAEAADIAAFLLQQTPPADAAGAPTPLDQPLVQRGRDACVSLRCVACHTGLDVQSDAPATPPPHALADVDPHAGGSCIAPLDTHRSGRPWYPLTDAQRTAITLALDSLRDEGTTEHQSGEGSGLPRLSHLELTLLRLNCVACHERDDRGGVGTDRRGFFETVDHVDLGDEGRLPPRLTGVGARLQKDWLAKAVAGAVTLRPFMRARMPIYPKDVVAALPEDFKQADQLTGAAATNLSPAFPPPGDHASFVPAGAVLLDAGCIQCHPLGDKSLPGTVGVNLAGVTKRVEPEWFRRLLLDPMAVRPGTKMPAFFGATLNQTILGGNAERQIAALWAYLDRPALEPLPTKLAAATGDFELVPEKRPLLLRTFMERAGTHAIAIGFPAGVHLAFDADACRLAEAWHGRFLDARGTWVLAKSAPPADPLGTDRIVIDTMPAVTVLHATDDTPSASHMRFLGYVLDRAGVPTFRYRIDTPDGAAEITDRFEPEGAGGGGLVRRLTVRRPTAVETLPSGLVFRVLTGTAINVTVDDDGGVTAATPDAALTATLDTGAGGHTVSVDSRHAWVVPLEADDTTLEVRYRW